MAGDAGDVLAIDDVADAATMTAADAVLPGASTV